MKWMRKAKERRMRRKPRPPWTIHWHSHTSWCISIFVHCCIFSHIHRSIIILHTLPPSPTHITPYSHWPSTSSCPTNKSFTVLCLAVCRKGPSWHPSIHLLSFLRVTIISPLCCLITMKTNNTNNDVAASIFYVLFLKKPKTGASSRIVTRILYYLNLTKRVVLYLALVFFFHWESDLSLNSPSHPITWTIPLRYLEGRMVWGLKLLHWLSQVIRGKYTSTSQADVCVCCSTLANPFF